AILHPTAAVLPAVLAVAEQRGVTGREALVAYCLGMEAAIRLGAAAKGGFQRQGFHATGVLGHFSAALAAGRLMGAEVTDHVNALGMAASTASGVQVYLEDGAWTKRLHPGWAASTGITCATFGRHGFVGPARPLEGRFGIFDTHLPDAVTVELAEITEGLGHQWKLADTALKPYPVCHYIHGAAEAAIGLQGEIGGAEIDAVEILLPDETMQVVAEPIEQKRRTRSAYEAQFSAPYVVATALLKGRFGLAELSEAALADAEVQALAARCTCVTDPHSRFPDFYSGGLRLVLADGRRLEAHVPVNNGAGPRRLSLEAAQAKFIANAGLTLPAARTEAVAQAVAGLEDAPISALMETLATPA
ncbi:MmgE/PrpD family protein, partial [Vannielia litorea]|uniref:MmgE/PrpD family protein n=1 Tax=Vannielia litorea TaxID=1217970 RepID=UPI001BCACD41